MSTTAMALFLAGFLFALPVFLFGLGRLAGPLLTRMLAQTPTSCATLRATQSFDLHGLASIRLSADFRALGLEEADPRQTPAEQLDAQRHAHGLVFGFVADTRFRRPSRAWQPLRMNIVLLDPDTAASTLRQDFSMDSQLAAGSDARSPQDPGWQEHREDPMCGGRCWRWRSLTGPGRSAGSRRWALSLHDPRRAIRIEILARQTAHSLGSLRALAARTLDSLSVGRERDAYYRRRHLQPSSDVICP